MNVYKELLKNKDEKFRIFEANLVPTINIKNIIGVRSPIYKSISKKLYQSGEYKRYIEAVPHKYLEENLVHAHIIEYIKDYDECIYAIKKLAPYIDNWMVSDCISSKILENNKDKLIKFISQCLKSKKVYTIRLGIIFLKKYYLDDNFNPKHIKLVMSVKNDDYYVKMIIAWYFAEGLIKQYDSFIKIIKAKKLEKFVQNKSIQKARESFRIPKKLKDDLLKYKV